MKFRNSTLIIIASGLVFGFVLRSGLSRQSATTSDDSQKVEAVGSAVSPGVATTSAAGELPTAEDVLTGVGGDRLSMLIDFLANADAGEIADLAFQLPTHVSVGQHNGDLPTNAETLAWRLIFARWFEIDREGALEFSSSVKSSLFRRLAIESFGITDPEAALAMADHSKPNDVTRFTQLTLPWEIGGSLWKTDPQRYWQMVESASSSEWSGQRSLVKIPKEALLALAQTDPKLAAEHASAVRNGSLREVFGIWAESDPEKLIAEVFEKPSGGFRFLDGRVVAMAAIAQRDPERALQILDEIHLGDMEESVTAALVHSWAANDAARAMAWADQLSDELIRKGALVSIAASLAETDPRAAASILDGLGWDISKVRGFQIGGMTASFSGDQYTTITGFPAVGSGTAVKTQVLAQLARVDRDAALAVATTPQMLGVVVSEIAKSDPRDAVDLLLENGDERSIRSTTRQWLYENLDERYELAISGSIERADDQVVRDLLIRLAHTHPDDVARWIETDASVLPDSIKGEVISVAVGNLAYQDPEAAVEMVRAGIWEVTPQTYGLVAREFLNIDRAATAAWLNDLPEGPGRDAGVAAQVVDLRTADSVPDFEGALALAASITDPQKRSNSASQLIEQWRKEQPGSLQSSIDGSRVPENLRDLTAGEERP